MATFYSCPYQLIAVALDASARGEAGESQGRRASSWMSGRGVIQSSVVRGHVGWIDGSVDKSCQEA